MQRARVTTYALGLSAILIAGAAVAKEPERSASTSLATPAGCTDSLRGRTHILRFCGDEHYWIKRPGGPPRLDLSGPAWAGDPAVVSQGPAQNWGGFQRY